MFGMTVLAASGDNGSNCYVFDGRAHCYFPQTSPWVTTCGGTTIGNVSGSSFTEITWNDNGITGGGISDYFDPPHWQRHADVPLSVNPGTGRAGGFPTLRAMPTGIRSCWEAPVSPAWLAPARRPRFTPVTSPSSTPGWCTRWIPESLPLPPPRENLPRHRRRPHQRHQRRAGYVSVPGWDPCTGWGVIKGSAPEATSRGRGMRKRSKTGGVSQARWPVWSSASSVTSKGSCSKTSTAPSIDSRAVSLKSGTSSIAVWADRIVTTVLADRHHPQRPMSIIFRSPPDFHP